MKTTVARSAGNSSARMNSSDKFNSWPVRKITLKEAEIRNDAVQGSAEIRQTDEKGDIATRETADACRTETIIVDQNGLFREGLKHLLAETAYYPDVSAASLDDVRSKLETNDGAILLI